MAVRLWVVSLLLLFHSFHTMSAEVQLRFGSMEVANNSYVRAGHIPSDANGGDGLLCASDTTNPTTRQWYNPNGSAVGTTPPTIGTYQSDTDGGVLLYRRGNLERDITGMYYCIISNSSGNSHTLYAGLYTTEGDTATVSGRANDGPDFVGGIQFELKTAPNVDPPVFQLTCTSSTAPATTVQWSKDGSPVSGRSSSQIVTDRTEATYINELTVIGGQNGTYNCTVTTRSNETEVVEEIIIGSPITSSFTVEASTKPANVTADAVNPTTVDVAWTASTTVSTEYWIYYASGGGEDSGSAGVITGTSHTLGSLQDGLTYNITVIAVDGSHLPSEGVTVIVELERAGGGNGGVVAGVVVVVILLLLVAVVVVVIVLLWFFFLRGKRKEDKEYANITDNEGRNEEREYANIAPSNRSNLNSTAPGNSVEMKPAAMKEPVIETFPKGEICVLEGESVALQVRVTGVPTPTLTWYHNGKEVVADYSTELREDGSLFIASSELRHGGLYRMVVHNSSGKEERSVKVRVYEEGAESAGPVQSGNSVSAAVSCIPVADFGNFVVESHSNNNSGFRKLFAELYSGSEHPVTIGLSSQNKTRNRFANITVYDDNRIVLKPVSGSQTNDYINASYIDGNKSNMFIATQGPLPKTEVDLWHMVWQEKAPSIVMITNIKEGDKIKCSQYWPDSGSKEYGPFKVTITDQQMFADYVVRQFQLSHSESSMKVTQFHFTAWPDHGVPEYATPILAYHRRVKSKHVPAKGPLVIHCSAGVGRTGTFITIDTVLEQAKKEGVVDIAGVINKLRHQRMKMVQTVEQFIFIHDAILESITCGDTQIITTDLRKMIVQLGKADPSTGLTGFSNQFKVLMQVTPKPSEVRTSIAAGHKDKNRSMDFLPPDNSRLVLKGEQPDYVHACYVNGYKHSKAYIIAQGPLKSTCRDFWKMVLDRKCAAIVMLSQVDEGGEEVCHRYWPSGAFVNFNDIRVDCLEEESKNGFLKRSFQISSSKSKEAAHQVTQFHILNWRQDGECSNVKTITDVIDEVWKVQRRTGNNPIVVHCSDTVGRSGMFCAIATTIERCKSEGVVDVFQVVKAMRIQKPGAVLTVDQYQFIFDAVLVFLDSFDTYANFQ